ncbi:2763_t:CDS:2 [Dentiscutata erythropus]|uniref:2763_t:CDS:1 n=1 Tax=Dentiscutata erythropus TaxID=1348616 RepID=A0A9N9GGD1_9GLOM|nr:2763_t:CDS:2 [Dentiscutata erythropus]
MDPDSSIITDPESSLVIDDYNEIYDTLSSPELETNSTSTLTNNARKPSPLWFYFEFKAEEPNHPICKKCSIKFSDKTGNSSLEKHLSLGTGSGPSSELNLD